MKIEPIEVSAVSEAARLIADSFMGTEAAGQKTFELIPFDKIAFDTASAAIVEI